MTHRRPPALANALAYALALMLANALAPTRAHAADWPAWGGTPARNMVSSEKGLPASFNPGRPRKGTEEIDLATTRNVRWVAKLGSQSYGNPTVAHGRVLVGTNNRSPRDPRVPSDRGILMSFDEASGAFQWQLSVPKLGSGKVNDWEYLGICSSPTIDGERAYLVTNRGEVIALDLGGLADGDAGPFHDEGQYLAGPGNPKLAVGAKDADIVWRFDMREELGVFPHNATSSAPLIVGDRLYVSTSNGVDWSHLNIPSPKAPALIALDKRTGELLGEEASGISERTFHSNWSSAALARVAGKDQVVFGGGDGFCYGFDPAPVEDKEGLRVLRELWRFDGNPAALRVKDGKPIKYATPLGPSEIIATPVFADGRIYAAIGQDPEHGSGLGNLSCIDPAGRSGDVTASAKVWSFDGIGRSLSTVAVHDGWVYTADFDGRVYCLDARSGKLAWSHDSRSHIWGSPLVADGKVYVGNEDGQLMVFAAGAKKRLLATVQMPAPIYATPVAANGTLYVTTQTHLYAVALPSRAKRAKRAR